MAHTPKLRYVDPHKRRGRVYLTLCRFSATTAGAWLSVNVAWKVDPYLLKLTRGRFSTATPVAAALLESRGARTGQPERHALLPRRRSGNDHRVAAGVAEEPSLVLQPPQSSRRRFRRPAVPRRSRGRRSRAATTLGPCRPRLPAVRRLS